MISWDSIETKWRTKWNQSKEFEIEPDNRPKKVHHSRIPLSKFSTTYRTW